MSENYIDPPPAPSGDNPLIAMFNTQFEQLQARIDTLEKKRQRDQFSAQLVKSPNRQTPIAQPVPITDPNAYLASLLTTITDLNRPLTDAEILAYRDECKNAILALRAGQVGSTTPSTRATIAYEAATRQAFIAVMAVLFDNARSRDPYAAQLQIS